MKNKKNRHIEVPGLTQSGQEPVTLLDLQHLNSLWLMIRANVSNMLRHNYLLLLQDLTAACCSIFGSFLQSSKCSTRTLPGPWDLCSGTTHSFQRGASLTCSCFWDCAVWAGVSKMMLHLKTKQNEQTSRWKAGIGVLYRPHTFQNLQWTDCIAVQGGRNSVK